MAANGEGARSRYERYVLLDVSTGRGWAITTVVEPARLFSANGIRFGSDGRCWVAEVWGGSISAWDTAADELSTISPTGGELTGPDDLALGPDGSVYVTEYLEGLVGVIRPDGTYDVLFDDSPKANGITVDHEGRLFVDEFRPGGRLYELDPRRPGKPRVIADLDHPNALERGVDGRLYLQDAGAGTVLSIDPDSGGMRTEFDGFGVPSSVRFDPHGRVVVTDFATGQVSALDLGTRERTTLAELIPGVDNLCFDRQGRLYVSNAITCEIVRVSNGRIDARTGGGFVGPYGLAAESNGAVLVADDLRIARVVPGAPPVTVWDPSVAAWSHRIRDVAWTAGSLFAVTTEGHVLRLDLAAGTSEVLYAPNRGREAVSIASCHNGVVVGTGEGLLLELDASGTVVSTRQSGLRSLADVSCDGTTVVACDSSAGQVALHDGSEVRILDGFSMPEAVALADGGVFVAETGARRISWVSGVTHARQVLATGLPLGYPRPLARRLRRSPLAALPDGSVVVGCDGDGSLRRLSRT